MSVKLLSETHGANVTDEDRARIEAILEFWFAEKALSAPQIDGRMDIWFGEDAAFDEEIRRRFTGDVEAALEGTLDHWAKEPRGRLALILLLDQFPRNIHRGTADAYAGDKTALKLCVEGAMGSGDKGLSAIERVFFYMPLQHAESRKVQARSVTVFQKLADAVSPTYSATFQTVAQFAELHRDIVDQFGRFPHRNRALGRDNTPEEEAFLAGDSPSFGQG